MIVKHYSKQQIPLGFRYIGNPAGLTIGICGFTGDVLKVSLHLKLDNLVCTIYMSADYIYLQDKDTPSHRAVNGTLTSITLRISSPTESQSKLTPSELLSLVDKQFFAQSTLNKITLVQVTD